MRASIFFLLLPLPPLLYSSLSFIIYYPSSACFDILLPYSRLVGCWDAPWFSFFFFWLPVSLIVFIWISSWCLKMLQDASGCFRMLQDAPRTAIAWWLIDWKDSFRRRTMAMSSATCCCGQMPRYWHCCFDFIYFFFPRFPSLPHLSIFVVVSLCRGYYSLSSELCPFRHVPLGRSRRHSNI